MMVYRVQEGEWDVGFNHNRVFSTQGKAIAAIKEAIELQISYGFFEKQTFTEIFDEGGYEIIESSVD